MDCELPDLERGVMLRTLTVRMPVSPPEPTHLDHARLLSGTVAVYETSVSRTVDPVLAVSPRDVYRRSVSPPHLVLAAPGLLTT